MSCRLFVVGFMRCPVDVPGVCLCRSVGFLKEFFQKISGRFRIALHSNNPPSPFSVDGKILSGKREACHG